MQRLCPKTIELVVEAIEAKGLDLKNMSVANVRDHLETMISEENEVRERNGLPKLTIPSHRTISNYRKKLVRPSGLEAATKGERTAHNTRGRGSTDIRSLRVGETVEIDECKLSLVTEMKTAGFWEKLTEGDRRSFEPADEEKPRDRSRRSAT